MRRAPPRGLSPAVVALAEWLRAERIPHAVIGAIAVGLLSEPRGTEDVDALVLVDEAGLEGFVARARPRGFESRQPDAVAFARRARVLLLRHRPTGVPVDLALAGTSFEAEAIARGREIPVAGTSVRVPSPKDLVLMKLVAGREKGLVDVERVLAANPRADRRRIEAVARLFAEGLDAPEILDRAVAAIDRDRRRATASRNALRRLKRGSGATAPTGPRSRGAGRRPGGRPASAR